MKVFYYLALLFLVVVFGNNYLFAVTVPGNSGSTSKQENVLDDTDSCTERCHVDYMAYENEKSELSKRRLTFRHKTHSAEQDLDCLSCHNDIEVNKKGHGELIIGGDDCLQCHHVELEGVECKKCHNDIDRNRGMKYKKKKFLHGFTAESGVDCRLCHKKDTLSPIRDDVNCIKYQHTNQDLDCLMCHNNDVDKPLLSDDLQRTNRLSWTTSFNHSEHPGHVLACSECHKVDGNSEVGMIKYGLNCSRCHHGAEQTVMCEKCHEEPYVYMSGRVDIKEIARKPDMMSRAVKCKDCHVFNGNNSKFKEVKNNCIKCHDSYYGRLFDAWQDTIKNRLVKFNERMASLYRNDQLLSTNVVHKKGNNINSKSGFGLFTEETEDIVNLVTKYGIHNFNLTRSVLDYLEEKAGLK